jgi:hypothetical protein
MHRYNLMLNLNAVPETKCEALSNGALCFTVSGFLYAQNAR